MDDGTADLAYNAIDTMRLLVDPKSIPTFNFATDIIQVYFNGIRLAQGANWDYVEGEAPQGYVIEFNDPPSAPVNMTLVVFKPCQIEE